MNFWIGRNFFPGVTLQFRSYRFLSNLLVYVKHTTEGSKPLNSSVISLVEKGSSLDRKVMATENGNLSSKASPKSPATKTELGILNQIIIT